MEELIKEQEQRAHRKRLPTSLAAVVATFLVAPATLAPTLAHAQFVCTSAGGVDGAVATKAGAVACGTKAAATGLNSTAVGSSAQASGDSSTAAGQNSTASGVQSTALGFTNVASGDRSQALGGRDVASAAFSSAVGWANTASGVDSFAGGNKSVAAGASSVALGDVAQSPGDFSVALGAHATAQGASSVALGANSVASDPNTVSVGSDTLQRRITNVAPGTQASDAATVGQLDFGLNDVRRRADAGSAAAMAAAGLPQAFTAGKGMIGVAIGTWGSEQGFALGASKVFGSSFVVKVAASFDTRGDGGANAGVGWEF
jgi:autotransporter adhesin